MELSAFSAINRFQPFNVAVSSNVLLLMVGRQRQRLDWLVPHVNFFLIPFFQDFHCHLTSSEVVGYLGGRWDTNTQRELPFTSLTLIKKKMERSVLFSSAWGLFLSVLTVLRAFPCRTRLADKDAASAVEEEVRRRPGRSRSGGKRRCFYALLRPSPPPPPPDLPEPVHARAVPGGLVPQPPAGSGSALAAGHRLPDGPPAEAAGVQQRLPALPGHHLR